MGHFTALSQADTGLILAKATIKPAPTHSIFSRIPFADTAQYLAALPAVPEGAMPGNTQPVRKERVWLVGGAHVLFWGASYTALNKAWYANYPQSSFHFFNDNHEWNQMDKAGHAWTAYQMGRLSTELWWWSGIPRNKSTWLGGFSAIAYQSIIEIQDGKSAEWGFSWGDMAANTFGAAAFVAQELTWKEQRFQIKLSYSPYNYKEPGLNARRDELFGKSFSEQLLKDYNSQTYWISANLRSFLPDSKLPHWLNIAAGYGADGMLGGRDNSWTDKGNITYSRYDIERTRHYYLSLDVDLTRIRTRSKLLRSVFFVLNTIKIPAPTLELNSKGQLRTHVLK